MRSGARWRARRAATLGDGRPGKRGRWMQAPGGVRRRVRRAVAREQQMWSVSAAAARRVDAQARGMGRRRGVLAGERARSLKICGGGRRAQHNSSQGVTANC
uniref:Uncharacterized protein n=1 Tax=Setaria viridis TaxID=4556 RepID=A0A4U6VQE4_SETVI|nr:hypothetical protein SEVIR_3G216366v2 [Setaria viridis]